MALDTFDAFARMTQFAPLMGVSDYVEKQPYAADLSCAYCIGTGNTFVYNKDTTKEKYYQELATGEDYNGHCCKKGDACDTYKSNLKSTDFKDFGNSMFACPHKVDRCGSRTITVTSKSSPEVIRTTDGLDKDNSCHWLVKAQCDMPMFTVEADSEWYLPIDVVSLAWFSYQENDPSFVPYTKSADYPDKTMTFNYIDAQKFGFKLDVGTMAPLKKGSTTFDPTKLLNDIRDKKAANLKYEKDYRQFLRDQDKATDSTNAPTAPTKPTVLKASDYPGYDTFDYSTYEHTVGWGAPSKDVYALSKLSYYAREVYFGVFGQRGIYDKDFIGGVSKNPDPKDSCNAKYIGINLVVWDSTFKQPAGKPLKIKASAQKMRDLDFTIPELVATPTSSVEPVEGSGASWLKASMTAVGLMFAATCF